MDEAKTSRGGLRRTRRFFRLLLTAALVTAWTLTLPAGANSVIEPVKIGEMSRFPADVAKAVGIKSLRESSVNGPQGTAVVAHKLDRLYQIWNMDQHEKLGTGMIVAERDLGSLKLTRWMFIANRTAMQSDNSQTGTEFVTDVDTKRGRLFIEFGSITLDSLGGGFIVIDLRKWTYTDKAYPAALVRPQFKAQAVYGLEYDETTDTLILLLVGFDENFQIIAPVQVVGWAGSEFNQSGPLPGPPGMMGPRVLRGCRQNPIATVQSTRMGPIMIADGPDLDSAEIPQPIKTWVVIPCLTTPYSVNTALIRMERSTLFEPNGSEKTIPAPSGIANWIMDETRGRLHLLNASRETDDWVYEVKSNAFIGIIELSPKGYLSTKSVGLGMDELTGRLFAFGLHWNASRSKIVSSLMIAAAAQDPVPQADIYDVGGTEDADALTLVDGRRNRVLVLRRVNNQEAVPRSWDDAYTQYAVPEPLPPNPEDDPDSRTKQVVEKEGKTIAEYGGNATAYGARILLAAGFTGMVPSNGLNSVGTAYKDMGLNCGLRDREMVLGGFAETSLASGAEPDALAEAVHLDGGTEQDFGKPSRCDLYYQYVGPVYNVDVEPYRQPYYFTSLMHFLNENAKAEQVEALCAQYIKDERCDSSWADRVDRTVGPTTAWSYRPAECSSPGQVDKPGQNSTTFRGDTWVDCKKETHVQAHAEGRADGVLGTTAAPLAVKIGRAISTTSVKLDPKLGLVSDSLSRVENIVIGPVTIGFIQNKARSFAHGLSGTAGTETYRPEIGLVKGPGITSCAVRCDIDVLIPQLNNALAGRAEFRTLTPDSALKAGSPGGYQSGIIKSEKQAASDNALVGDKSREVPALEVIIYNDNPQIGRARQVLQFAGVRADSHYGIQVFDDEIPCGPECEPPVEQPEPQIVDRVVTVEGPGTTRTITKPGRIRYAIPGGYRLLLANPRAAGGMLTVWLLLAAPFVIAGRRKRLSALS